MTLKELITKLDNIADTYNHYSVIQNEISDRLLEHLNEIPIKPKTILNLGAKTGYTSKSLQKKFPTASIFSLDISEQLIVKIKNGLFKNSTKIVADPENLSFLADSFDLVFSNLSLHWFNSKKVFSEVFSILTVNALFLFSTFGPNNLNQENPTFEDMHQLGDSMLQIGFSNPVMETEQIDFVYKNSQSFATDLFKTGYEDLLPQDFSKEINNYQADLEVIYGQAWKHNKQNFSSETIIPITEIKKN